tara:strand:- start:2377 stop:2976 length:600 start_codon:yes stop_codon:yes gene_type:complete
MKIIDYNNSKLWDVCCERHKAKCKLAPNWFIGLLFELSEKRDLSYLKIAIETGTYRGETTKLLSDSFDKVYSIEKYYNNNWYGDKSLLDLYEVIQSENPNISIKLGDSVDHLRDILNKYPSEPIMFLLDAHNGPDGPIKKELEIIRDNSNSEKHVIIIDDWGDFVSIHAELKSIIMEINPSYKISETDYGRAGITIIHE